MSLYALTPEAEQERLRLIHYPVYQTGTRYAALEPATCASCRVYWRLCRVFGATNA